MCPERCVGGVPHVEMSLGEHTLETNSLLLISPPPIRLHIATRITFLNHKTDHISSLLKILQYTCIFQGGSQRFP